MEILRSRYSGPRVASPMPLFWTTMRTVRWLSGQSLAGSCFRPRAAWYAEETENRTGSHHHVTLTKALHTTVLQHSAFYIQFTLTSWIVFQHWIQTEGLVSPCDQDILSVCRGGIVTAQSDRSKQHCGSLCLRNINLDRQQPWEKRERDP